MQYGYARISVFFDEWDSGECCKDDPIEMETTTTEVLPTCRSVYLYVYVYAVKYILYMRYIRI